MLDCNVRSQCYSNARYKSTSTEMKVSHIPVDCSAHVISIRSVIGDLLAREIILRNSAGEIPRLRDSIVLHTNTHTRIQRMGNALSDITLHATLATKVQQSKFRDGRHHADLVLFFSPTNSALKVKLASIDPELSRRMDLALKILF